MEQRPSHGLLARNALGVGLAALIPLPFIDEFVRRKLLRDAFRASAADAGVQLEQESLHLLVRDQGSLFVSVLKALLFWPIKKLFRTIIYVLTIKDVLDWTTEAALRAEMVHMAAQAGWLPHRAAELRLVMDAVLDRHRFSPVSRVLTGGERPDMAWPGGRDPLLGGVGKLVRWGGGGKILVAFAERLGPGDQPFGS